MASSDNMVAAPEECHYSIIPDGETSYSIYLFHGLDATHYYTDLCAFLRSLSNKSEVRMHINCEGGSLSTTMSILYAMMESQAHITTVAEGLVASGATLIFLSGDDFHVMPFTQFLFHPASSGEMGKLSDMKSSVESSQQLVKGIYETCYDGFLTEEEISQVVEYKEFYMDSEEVQARLEAMIKKQTQEAEEAMQLELDLGEKNG